MSHAFLIAGALAAGVLLFIGLVTWLEVCVARAELRRELTTQLPERIEHCHGN